MKAKKLDGVEVWKEFEDVATRLDLNVVERAVYSHLLLHTRIEGKLRERFTIAAVADKVRISRGPVREAMRRLADHGALRFVERRYSGHLLEVRLPAEVPAARLKRKASVPGKAPGEDNLEQKNFLTSQAPRARGRQVFLLPTSDLGPVALLGPRRAAGQVRAKLLPQRGFLLYGVQLAKEGSRRGGFSARVVPAGRLVA